jgi:alpha-L-fucosidase 2
MEDGDRAYKLITDLITPDRTAPNLFDLHPPFQIDGNFGAVSGVCEMLLQSHSGELNLLPALPSAWPTGQVAGLRARGGATVDLDWKNGQLEKVTIVHLHSGPFRVRMGEAVLTRDGRAGKSLSLTASDFKPAPPTA